MSYLYEDVTDLDTKIDSEGGIFNALRYGIMPEHIADPELAALWGRLLATYLQMLPHMRAYEEYKNMHFRINKYNEIMGI